MNFYNQQQQQPPQAGQAVYNPGYAYPSSSSYGINNNNNQHQHQGNAANTPNNNNYLQFQNVSPEMLNLGINAGKDILNQQKERFLPGVFGFINSLKYYFTVNNSYVSKKLALIFYPLSNKYWARMTGEEFQNSQVSSGDDNTDLDLTRSASTQVEGSTHKWATPRNDPNAPDLYIPLMSFITYVLLFGLSRGLATSVIGSKDTFSPEILIQAIWRCLLLQLLETGAIKIGANVLSSSLPTLDIFAYTGYKYVVLCSNVLALLLRRFSLILYGVTVLYTAIMLAYFVMKNLAAAIPAREGTGVETQRSVILVGFGALQLVLVLFMSWV